MQASPFSVRPDEPKEILNMETSRYKDHAIFPADLRALRVFCGETRLAPRLPFDIRRIAPLLFSFALRLILAGGKVMRNLMP